MSIEYQEAAAFAGCKVVSSMTRDDTSRRARPNTYARNQFRRAPCPGQETSPRSLFPVSAGRPVPRTSPIPITSPSALHRNTTRGFRPLVRQQVSFPRHLQRLLATRRCAACVRRAHANAIIFRWLLIPRSSACKLRIEHRDVGCPEHFPLQRCTSMPRWDPSLEHPATLL